MGRRGGKKKKATFAPKSRAPGRQRRQRPNLRQRAEPRSGWSSIVPFARTLLSYLPGQVVIKPVSDFVFRGLGLTKGKLVAADGKTVTAAEIAYTGCGSLVRLYVSDLLAGSRECIRYTSSKKIETTVDSVRMHFLRIRVLNPTPSGTRQGQWCAAYIPDRSGEEVFTKERRTPMQYRDVCQLPGAVIGPANRPLVLTHRYRPMSGDACALTLEAGASIGWLVITFEDLNRETYHELKPSEFQCSVELSGQFMAFHSFGNNVVSSYSDTVQDYLSSTSDFMSVRDVTDGAFYKVDITGIVKKDDVYSVTGTAALITVPGTRNKPDLKVLHSMDILEL